MAEPLDRETLIAAITTFLGGQEPGKLDEIREALGRDIAAAGQQTLLTLVQRLATDGADWSYYPPDPLARRIHHLLADRILQPDSGLFGMEHLAGLADAEVVIFSNHLSYSDANCLEVLLHRAGSPLADRLTAIAGPKVYSSLKRRFSSLCFGTIKTPQSSALSTEDAVMNPREVARAARRSIEVAHERLRAGDALLVFAEGTRSRTYGLQPMLAGATRYLDGEGTYVLPVGITGTEALFPVGGETLHSVRTVARFGPPIKASALREHAGDDRRIMMDTIGLAIAELLPLEFQGAYGDDAADLGDARRVRRRFLEAEA
jgi:1-acyl-sn-glycerol-3-phosphate acyltransferase